MSGDGVRADTETGRARAARLHMAGLQIGANAARIAELWDAERCIWKLDYDAASYSSKASWRVDLEWTSEYDNPHHADWATYTWQFYGDTAGEVLADAVEWCEGLLPFERCAACDGAGSYGPPYARTTCEPCGGSGLERAEVSA